MGGIQIRVDRLLVVVLGIWGVHPAILPDRTSRQLGPGERRWNLSTGVQEMVDAFDRRSAAKDSAEVVFREELDRAERAATRRIRDKIRDIPPERRHLVTIGERSIEVIETAAVDEILAS